jgi:2-isopropylmalate synthase
VECTINGIGERAGNAALEEIVMAMRVRADRLPLETNVRTEEIYRTSRLLSEITGVDVQPNKAIVGRNAFAHEAGIHQHGVLNNPLCYEIMTPESVGVPNNSIVLGKHSGRHALSKRYLELGCSLTSIELDLAYGRFTRLADKKKRIYDQDILSLLPAGQRARLEHFQTESAAEALTKKRVASASY